MANPVVAIVGRPNVGKSTVFNRIAGERISIVEDTPGVTRDRIYAKGEWLGQPFNLIDTGGIDMGDEPFLAQITEQAQIAIDEADVIVFVTSVKEGVTDADEKVAKILYRTDKPVILAVNKVDNPELRSEIYDFYSLGFGDPMPLSGTHGIGTGDLLDKVCQAFPKDGAKEQDDSIKFSFIGRPNVGKSSLVNAILGENRVIVSNVEGTTRDAIDTKFVAEDGTEFTMIDTAGIRKKGKVYENTEKYSVLRAMRAIDRSDVVCVVLNAEEGIREQDKHVAGYAHEAGRGIIIVVNKWDTLKKDNHNHERRISSAVLNDVIMDAIAHNPTPTDNGRRLRVYYATQVATKPPTFVVFVNDPELMHFSYERFLENQIRAAFDFEGTPIHVIERRRK